MSTIRKTWAIYKIMSLSSGKVYIGLTSYPVARRWGQHCSKAKRSPGRSLLHRAIRREGKDNFSVLEICRVFSQEEAVAAEREQIALHGSMVPNGFNLTSGGEGQIGVRKSLVTRQRLSASGRGVPRPHSPEHRANLSIALTGRKASAAARENMRQAHLGKSLSEDHRRAQSAAQKGRKLSDVELQNLDWTGRKHSKETKEILRQQRLGGTLPRRSIEARAKISEGRRRSRSGEPLPVGVYKKRRKYHAMIWDGRVKKKIFLGSFSTPIDAGSAYQAALQRVIQ